MSMKCDKCDKPAMIHLTDIEDGQKKEVHLCEDCAVAEGITFKATMPLSQLLEDFVLQASGKEPAAGAAAPAAEPTCEACGITFSEFRQKGLLGCPHDYEVFQEALTPLLQRAQENTVQHVGKVPRKADLAEKKQAALLRLRAALRNAVAAEDYERAAGLRDQIKELERP